MKKIIFASILGLIALSSCQQNTSAKSEDVKELTNQVMSIHDEIMPQISHFDRATIKIDSILANLNQISSKDNAIDTAATRQELIGLKNDLETATDNMMTWMKEYSHDSTDVNYQNSEVEKVKALKKSFEDASLKSNTILGKF